VFCQYRKRIFLLMWNPNIDPSCIQAWRSWSLEQPAKTGCFKIKCAPRLFVTKVYKKVSRPLTADCIAKVLEIVVVVKVANRCEQRLILEI
jgi:hypothetical protein